MQQMFQDRSDAARDTRPWAQIESEVGRPEDIAAAAVFLASPGADYVNGATMRVDGGITATTNP